ncbi:MAG: hypothetical protein DRI44_00105 [Chlamydiae bacterium]|nr:MAG: hypothetical protein DRI44_00105 [Chlamydiota bacterium]
MKTSKFIIGFIFVALALVASTYASPNTKEKGKKLIVEDCALLCEASENRSWIFETSTNWAAGNLVYGPIEILAGVGTPVIGMFAGFGAGIAVPHFFMKKGSEILLPATIPCGTVAGAACGLAITPICAIEGLFDTLTGGFFADGYFSWINTSDLKSISMKTVQDEIVEQTTDQK